LATLFNPTIGGLKRRTPAARAARVLPRRKEIGGVLAMFRPPPDAPPMQGSRDEIKSVYATYRTRQLSLTFVAYAVYYFVRKNLPVVIPLMEKDLGITKSSLGGFLTAQDVLYGTSKFANGYYGDRSNARTFLAFGLLLSGLLNIAFGLSTTVLVMGLIWCLNGWFQGIGFPPCARVLSHWFAPSERGTMWGIWNSSHMVGAAGITVWAAWLGQTYGWRWAFFAPAVVAVVVSAILLLFLKDTPSELGLPPVERYYGEHADPVPPHEAVPPQEEGGHPCAPETPQQDEAEFRAFLKRRVFENPYIWLICAANFFVYVVRISFLNWAPTYLHEVKGYSLTAAGTMTASYEFAGLLGSVIAGIITDRFFRSRRAPICVLYMVGTAVAVLAFWKAPPGSTAFETFLLDAVGFLIYGPQFLVGVMTADIVSKRAAATAIGLTGFFGYLSGVLSGYGLGRLVELYGWPGGFGMLAGSAVASALCFAFCWNAGASEEDGET
jgi:OPA family glycerol-3-phosphate transporter-like MFS transporter/OPA family sugar phosphate sensor protein UhpC-like MFS transporter